MPPAGAPPLPRFFAGALSPTSPARRLLTPQLPPRAPPSPRPLPLPSPRQASVARRAVPRH
eukprot:scaffold67606_cov67-Phaeocystis_antarctica.AAC.7